MRSWSSWTGTTSMIASVSRLYTRQRRAEHALERPAAAHPRMAAAAPLPLGCPSEQHDSRSAWRARGGAGEGDQSAGTSRPVSTEREAPKHAPAANGFRGGVA